MKTTTVLLAIALFACTLLNDQNAAIAQTFWTKDATNPVLRRDTVLANLPHDIYAISDCWVLKEGATYKMWYTGGGLNYPTDTELRSRICYATSSDGVNWTKYAGNPVLDVSYNGAWDSLGVETVSVIIDEDAPAGQRYKMWYAGQYFNEYRYEIGYAYSADGISWTKHGNPVLQVGTANEWDNGFLEGPSVVKDGSTYQMWYCGYDVTVNGSPTDGKASIGYATSTDGINWTKYANNPIMVTGVGNWESVYVQDPHVIKDDLGYYMWYGGGSDDSHYDQQVGYATSFDGINWGKSPLNPVLTRGNPGDWDQLVASFPSVINDGGGYKMWYTGKDVDPLPENSTAYYWEIGYATSSPTGMEEFASNPNEMQIYPNPATETIYITFPPSETGQKHLLIFNSLGALVQTVNTNQAVQINIADLPAGLYFIQMNSDNGSVTNRLVKN
ncbi:MAG: T9SS type A sorting domain-containing protein [Flavobacteriales bacterium]|nr:T9SS type A sorting domain-containing protein [Flavobacteriales bacterium]